MYVSFCPNTGACLLDRYKHARQLNRNSRDLSHRVNIVNHMYQTVFSVVRVNFFIQR